MQKITAKEKKIKELLQNSHFKVDYYQREYKWQGKQVNELVDDLIETFHVYYKDSHAREEVAKYGSYFLGSIIICEKNGENYIIDGQQRLTTITLILILIHNRLKDDSRQDEIESQKKKIMNLVYSDVYGKKTYNIDIEERKNCMENLRKDVTENSNSTESVENIYLRYDDLKNSQDLNSMDTKELIFFSDWLIENVYLVEIKTESDEDAYTIFETMNDRGLSLTPLEMLKGYLLTRIKSTEMRNDAANIWKDLTEDLRKKGKDQDSEAFKSWLRSKYANTIREKETVPKDFEKIGTEFHRWVKENEKNIGLIDSDDFYNFIKKDMQFYSKLFLEIKNDSEKIVPGLEPVFYNASINFTLQNTLLLAPLSINDTEEVIQKKLYLTATYLDITLVRRLWNFKSISYDFMRRYIFYTIKDIRDKDVEKLSNILRKKLLEEDSNNFDSIFYLHQDGNKIFVRYILARITDFVERSSGLEGKFSDYMTKGRKGYEIEHIWANNYDWFKNEFSSSNDFLEYRNRIGGLLLLPRSFNASYGGIKYEEKVEHYIKNNILAQSLNKKCYEHNPGFKAFIEKYNLPFKPYEKFDKKALDERQELYSKLAKLVWSPDRLLI